MDGKQGPDAFQPAGRNLHPAGAVKPEGVTVAEVALALGGDVRPRLRRCAD